MINILLKHKLQTIFEFVLSFIYIVKGQSPFLHTKFILILKKPKHPKLKNEDFMTKEESKEHKLVLAKKKKLNGIEIFSAYDIHRKKEIKEPKLWDPFLQKVGLASVVGSSDTGKSSFLRQLALSIALGKSEFLGFKLSPENNRVIYVSTEDDLNSTKVANKMQLSKLMKDEKKLEQLKQLEFIFDTENLIKTLETIVSEKKVDLIIIDAFADVFTKEINSSTQVRSFLMPYHSLAIKNKCLVIFLHHNNKRSENTSPSKNNIVGSQGFEAKMRSILEIRKAPNDKRHMVLLKCNFLPSKFKKIKYILEFDEETLLFKNTKQELALNSSSKTSNPAIIKEVLELSKLGLSSRAIETKLKGTPSQIGKTAVANIIKENKHK